MSKLKQPIVQKRTLLIVGEGADEKAFLSYLKQQLVPRGAGLMVTIKNAKGKGSQGCTGLHYQTIQNCMTSVALWAVSNLAKLQWVMQ